MRCKFVLEIKYSSYVQNPFHASTFRIFLIFATNLPAKISKVSFVSWTRVTLYMSIVWQTNIWPSNPDRAQLLEAKQSFYELDCFHIFGNESFEVEYMFFVCSRICNREPSLVGYTQKSDYRMAWYIQLLFTRVFNATSFYLVSLIPVSLCL